MAAPNLVNTSAIYGKTAVQAVGLSATAILTNAAASGKVLKVNTLSIANVNGTSAADITADLFRGGVAYRICFTISVPADSSLVLVSKDAAIYLEEGDSIRLTASAANFLEAICSYEDLS